MVKNIKLTGAYKNLFPFESAKFEKDNFESYTIYSNKK